MWAFLAVLIGVALVVKFWPVIVGVVGVIVAVDWGRRVVDRHADRVAAERRRVAGLVARANREHQWVLAGDPRGTYGEFPPATYGEFPPATYGEFPPATYGEFPPATYGRVPPCHNVIRA
jgi:hypothetical protein